MLKLFSVLHFAHWTFLPKIGILFLAEHLTHVGFSLLFSQIFVQDFLKLLITHIMIQHQLHYGSGSFNWNIFIF